MTKKLNINLGDLKFLREKVGLSQNDLSHLLTSRFNQIDSDRKGISQQAISLWETGVHSPRLTPEEMLELCNVLDCTLLQLVEACKLSKKK